MKTHRQRAWISMFIYSCGASAGLYWGVFTAEAATIASTFAREGDEGWTGTNGCVVSWESEHLVLADAATDTYGIVAPPKFLGDLSGFNGGSLSYDWGAIYFSPGVEKNTQWPVYITGGGHTAVHILTFARPPDFWTNSSISLTASAWGKTESEWQSILSNVTEIQITLECYNAEDSVGFDSFILATGPIPEIVQQPEARTNEFGTAATFNVTASGTPVPDYQWRFNGAELTDGGRISGAMTAHLIITNLQFSDAGDYDVVATNPSGSVTSRVATLTVVSTSTRVWINASGGSWGVATNWTPPLVPGAADTAIITNNGTYAVTVDGNRTVTGLVLGGGTGTQTLTFTALTVGSAIMVQSNAVLSMSGGTFISPVINLAGTFNWMGGAVSDSTLTVAPGGVIAISGVATKYLTNSVLVNAGNVNWSNGTLGAAFSASGQSVLITNLAGGQFNIQAALTISSNNPSGHANQTVMFHNDGTLRRTTTSTAVFGIPLINSGVVELQLGVLQFTKGFKNSGAMNLTGGTIDLEGGVFEFAPSSQFPGMGSFLYDGTSSIVINGTVRNLNWTAGNLNNSTLGIATNGVLAISGSAKYLTNSALVNAGTVNWSSGTLGAAFSASGQNVLITNLAGGQFNIQAALTISSNNPNGHANEFVVFHNDGTLRKTGANTAYFWLPLMNTGDVEAQQGTLQFTKGFKNSGTMNLTGGTIDLEAGVFEFEPASRFPGVGSFLYDGMSSIVINGTLRNLNWTAGNLNNSTLGIATNGVLAISGNTAKYLTNSLLVNAGTVNWSDGTLVATFSASGQSVLITNLAGGQFNIQAALTISSNNPGSYANETAIFHNDGTLRKTAANTAYVLLPFINTGDVEAQQGTLQFTKGFKNSGTMDLTGGAIDLEAGVFEFAPPSQFPGTNCFTVNSSVAINGTLRNLTWTGGSLNNSTLGIATNGVLAISGAAAKYLTNSLLVNAGIVDWSGGTLGATFSAPGQSVFISNLAGGQFNMQGSLVVSSNNPSGYAGETVLFHNDGTLRKTGASTGYILLPFINTGEVKAQQGALQFTKGFKNSGTMNLTGGTIDLEAGVFEFAPPSQFPGTNCFTVDTPVTINGAVPALNWMTGGSLVDSTLKILSGGTLNWLPSVGSHSAYLINSTLINAGTVNLNGGFMVGSFSRDNSTTAITNLPGAVFNFRSAIGDPMSVSYLNFDTNGHVNVHFLYENMGKIDTTALLTFGAELNNRGTVELKGSYPTYFWAKYLQTDGLTRLNSKTVEATLPLQIQGGTIEGSGVITGSLTNNSVLRPGNPFGALTVSQRYTQTPNGMLHIELAGRTAGTTYDRLTANVAELAGSLNVVLSNGFAPAPGEIFQVLSCTTRSATFASINVPIGISVNYSNNGVFLIVTGAIPTQILGPTLAGGELRFSFNTVNGQSYTIERNDDLTTTNWVACTNCMGNGSLMQFAMPVAEAAHRFFRVRQP